jgi:hypothetical protein
VFLLTYQSALTRGICVGSGVATGRCHSAAVFTGFGETADRRADANPESLSVRRSPEQPNTVHKTVSITNTAVTIRFIFSSFKY